MSETIISDDGTRAVVGTIFGGACYEIDDDGNGQHVGLVGSEEDVNLFLSGDRPNRIVRVY